MNPNHCPHCDQIAAPDADHWKQCFWRMHHLLDHALLSITKMRLEELPDMNYADFVDEVSGTEENAWDVAAVCALRCLTDEMFPNLVDMGLGADFLEESGALGPCAPHRSPYANNWGKGLYVWLHERYPNLVKPWNDEIEQLSMTGSEGPIFRVQSRYW